MRGRDSFCELKAKRQMFLPVTTKVPDFYFEAAF